MQFRRRSSRVRSVETLEARQLLAISVANIDASGITPTQATVGAEVIETDGTDPTVTLYWGDEDGGTEVRQWDQAERMGARSVGQHFVHLQDLNPSTDYFFRTSAFTLAGSVWADRSSTFSTLELAAPTTHLQLGTEIGDSSVQLVGSIETESEVTSLTIFLGPNDAGPTSDGWTRTYELDAQQRMFSTFADQLSPNTSYVARLAASNGASVGWSDPLSFKTVEAPALRISEWMASNATVLPTRVRLSADDQFAGPTNAYDWIEIQNSTDATIDLTGYFLTDKSDNLTKWQVPEGTMVEAHDSLTILASNQDVRDPTLDEQGLLHANFALSSSGEYIALVAPDGAVVHQILDYPDQQIDVSYGYFGNALGQLPSPTPAAANLPISVTVEEVQHDVRNDQSILLTAKLPANQAVENVELTYRSMFEEETSIQMVDDGTGADQAAADGVYSALIPNGLVEAGQMVRYFVTATSQSGIKARLPRFLDDSGSPEYFGTVIDAQVESQLPVLHRFIERASRAESGSGTRASIYFNGEFYDNVFIRIRGGTARSWPKKSYKIEFNDSYHFRFQEDQRRVDEFNLNTTFTDKSYVRAVMSFELYSGSGGVGPITFPMRVEQNGEFFSVAHFVEQPDRDYLRRNGLDPDGALYKARHDRLNGLTGRAAGFFEKKTRHNEDESDLQALIDGLKLEAEQLEQFLFDHVDLPSQINLMAVNLILQNIDATDKNYYIYRDSEGNGEWRMLPWDLDLVLGPNALNTDNIVYNEENGPAHTSHPYLGTLQYPFHGRKNHLFDAVVKNTRTNEMFLRRVRTLMDEFLASSDTPEQERFFESKMDQLVEVLGPDVLLDKERWGRNSSFGGRQHTLDEAVNRIKTDYLEPRRTHLFETHNIDRLQQSEIVTIVPEFPENIQYFVPTNNDLGTTWTSLDEPANIAQWQTGQLGFGFGRESFQEFIKTEVRPKDACDACTSVFMRIPFALDDPDSVNELSLRMRYDDGFVAYVNGVEVIRQHLRGDTPNFDSRASNHRNSEAIVFENFDISNAVPDLNLGQQNMLAIHGLNSSASSNDMLFSAELVEGVFADANAVGIPNRQINQPTFELASFDAQPQSGNQNEEFVEIKNTSEEAIDISGWTLSGQIQHQFKAGTVVLPEESIFVVADSKAFRNRTQGATGGNGFLVQDRYEGSLADFSKSILMTDRTGSQIADFPLSQNNPGDLNNDGRVTVSDVDLLCAAIARNEADQAFDLTQDGVVDYNDVDHLVVRILGTTAGDANADGRFDSADLVRVFQAGEYDDPAIGNSTWSTGDWNCDGEFTSSDLVVAFQRGKYLG